MYIIPAIDLRNQKCVRLYQGDYNKETIYAEDPIAIAQQFQNAGSQWLHIVDLDGAKDPNQHQRDLIKKICQNTTLNVQTGGGIREQEQIEALLEAGVKRVIIGSLAVSQSKLVKTWLQTFGPERIVLAVDVERHHEDYYIAIHGWMEKSTQTVLDFLTSYQKAGLKHILCTDISRDGTLQGPNVELYQMILNQFPTLALQASGGVGCLDDLITLQQHHLSACIVGRALYEGKFTLDEAIGSVQHAC